MPLVELRNTSPVELKNMSLVGHAEPFVFQGKGMQALVKGLMAGKDTQSIELGNFAPKDFYHHPYGVDPATHGKLSDATVDIYHVPASQTEISKNQTIQRGEMLVSARQRLAVKTNRDGKVEFYRTSHPEGDRELNTNDYMRFVPINPDIVARAPAAPAPLERRASLPGIGRKPELRRQLSDPTFDSMRGLEPRSRAGDRGRE
ncbi:MAG: hypothetical protein EOR16_35735 [Mesorhizobium sp.]|uniref:hypothetical protein n=1 Tax=Mesorhizobium sp. TaxID=1871066 RepID=UPI000FE49463|nr:hypothetical protein [Mesorhizobium sp.]RWI46337.1 MAG: hypothetical protein EOR16_35735 [Mesorhizobium sp.]